MTLGAAFLHLFEPYVMLLMCGGVLLGIAIGVLPGINTGTLLVLVLPFTFSMQSIDAVVLLIALFVGGISGGLVTATLMRIPGEPNAIMTCLDGFPMAKSGRPGRALGLGNTSSIVGGALSWLALVLLTPPLAKIAVIFGPWETFSVVCMALVLIASLSRGSLLKGLITALLGMLVAMPGLDPSSGVNRLTFGSIGMTVGLQYPAGDPRHLRHQPVAVGHAEHRGRRHAARARQHERHPAVVSRLRHAWLEHGALRADRHRHRAASRRRRDHCLGRRLHDGEEHLEDTGDVRQGKRGSDRRSRKREQRHNRRNADSPARARHPRRPRRLACCSAR